MAKRKADSGRPVYIDSAILQVVFAVPNEDGELTKYTLRLPQVDQQGQVTQPLALTKAGLLSALEQVQDVRRRLAQDAVPQGETQE